MASTIRSGEAPVNVATAPITYRLHIVLSETRTLRVGALGRGTFPAGRYVYTGSARRHFEARVARHLRRRGKTRRWHIDYLLACRAARVVHVERLTIAECAANREVGGKVVMGGFGASDCRAGCGSHLRYLGPLPSSAPPPPGRDAGTG